MKSMTESLTAITNGIVFTGEKLVSDRVVLIKAGKVSGLLPAAEMPDDAEIVDVMGSYVVPGFIDLQIYGGGGRLFSASPTKETMDEIARGLIKTGTTSFMITMATNTRELVDEALTALSDYRHPALLGLHLEGPYLNPAKRGAHPAEYIRKPEKSEITKLLDRGKGCLRMMTVAPERFDPEIIALLLDRGYYCLPDIAMPRLTKQWTGLVMAYRRSPIFSTPCLLSIIAILDYRAPHSSRRR